jgi:hypothetical protein
VVGGGIRVHDHDHQGIFRDVVTRCDDVEVTPMLGNRIAATPLAALLMLLVLAGCAGQAPAGLQSFSDVDSALLDGGLIVCSSRSAPSPPGTSALETRVLNVGSTDAGELSAEGLNSEGSDACTPRTVTRVTVSRYADEDARNAGAEALQGLVGPDPGAAVRTSGDLTILVQSPSVDAPGDRVNEVLTRAGAG